MTDLFEHPEYSANLDDWQKYHDLYEGKHKVLRAPNYLWVHEIEHAPKGGSKKRKIREELSRYTNLIEPCISTYQSLFFGNDPLDQNLKADMDVIDEGIYPNVDGAKNNLVTFAKDKVLQDMLIYGRVFVYVDVPAVAVGTLGEQRAKGIRPFMKTISPLDVKDWQIDPLTGELQMIRWEYEQVEPRKSLSEKPTVSLYSRVFMLEGKSVISETYRREKKDNESAQWKLIESKPITGLSRIPVAFNVSGESWIKDGSEIQLKIFNLESCYDNDLHYQAYDRLFVIGNVDSEAKRAFKSYTVTFLPEGAQVQNVSAATSPLMERRIEKAFTSFSNVQFNRTFTLASNSKESPGPEAINAGRMELVELIKSTAIELENVMNDAVSIMFEYLGKETTEEFQLDKDITIEDVNEQIALFQAHMDDIKKVPRWHKDYLKKVAQSQNLENIDEVLEEIEKGNFEQQSIAADPNRPANFRTAVRDRLRSQLNGNVEEAPTDTQAPA